jgi:septum formation protein
LNLPFQAISPDVDESAAPDESVIPQVQRLAQAKASEVAKQEKQAWIIGSDQLAICGQKIIGKPGAHEQAVQQLRQIRGQTVFFHTGLCLLNSSTGVEQLDCVDYQVKFRNYSEQEIERYLNMETPYNCAASFKSESLGIALVESMQGPDPTALIGLPLISLSAMLRQEGLELP